MKRLYELAIKGINAEIDERKDFSLDTWMAMCESDQKVIIDTIAELKTERDGYIAKLDELTRPPIRSDFAQFDEVDDEDICHRILDDIEFSRFQDAFSDILSDINFYIIEPLGNELESLDAWLESTNHDDLTVEEQIIRTQVNKAYEHIERIKDDAESHLDDIEYACDQGAYLW